MPENLLKTLDWGRETAFIKRKLASLEMVAVPTSLSSYHLVYSVGK